MKYFVLLADGMADTPAEVLQGKTPMECACKPYMDRVAFEGRSGICRTVPEGMSPGSDVANLAAMGFDPTVCYTGRSPLEALSLGVNMADTDVAIRANLVTLSEEEPYEAKTMVDYSGGDISTAEAAQLIHTLAQQLGSEVFTLYAGVSYRHCLIWHHGCADAVHFSKPHDIPDRVIGEYLPTGEAGAQMLALMKQSYEILKEHPVNLARKAQGKKPANSLWFWGQGTKPALPSFTALYGLRGAVISAVDLLKGIGIGAGMDTPTVEGTTGYLDTNFAGKAEQTIRCFEQGCDYVFTHLEAPDECGHRGEAQNKVRSIEIIDEQILKPVWNYLEQTGEAYRILVLPDPFRTARSLCFVRKRRSRKGKRPLVQ